MCVSAHRRYAVQADLELFILFIIPKFATDFGGLAALDALACYSDKVFINKNKCTVEFTFWGCACWCCV